MFCLGSGIDRISRAKGFPSNIEQGVGMPIPWCGQSLRLDLESITRCCGHLVKCSCHVFYVGDTAAGRMLHNGLDKGHS